MAQLNEMVDSLNRLQHQVTIEQLQSEIDNLKRENNQLKLNASHVKQDNDRRFNSLNDEVNNLKSRILDLLLATTSNSEHVNKRICQNQTDETEQITDDYSQVDAYDIELSSLPDDAIHLILIRLPLRHRVLLRVICHRWKSIIESMCRSVRLLKLFGPTNKSLNYNKEADKSKHDILFIDMKRQVQAPKFHKGITQLQFIPRLFCNVDQLVLNFPKTFEITIMQLLESWAERLTSLMLDIEVGDQYLGEAIWHRITQLPKLESLTVWNEFINCFNAKNNQLDFLGQLRELRIGRFVSNEHKIIRFIGPNIRRLEMGAYSRNIFKEIRNRPTVIANVTHLNLAILYQSTPEQQQKMFQFFCRHFVSLMELKLDFFKKVPFDVQLTQLRKLPHLTKLHLYMTSFNLDRDLPPSIQFALVHSLVLHICMKPFTQRQIKPSQINITERSRISKFFNEIPRMFPVLVQLKIVAQTYSTVKIIEELVNGSALKSTDRIKWRLIEN